MLDERRKDWAATNIAALFKLNTPGFWGTDAGDDGNVLVLRSTNFKKASGLNYETAAPRRFDKRKLDQKRLIAGDIILERSGGSPSQPVGRVNRFAADGLFSASNFMQILRPAEGVDSYFSYYLLHDFYLRGGTETLQKATTGIRNLDFKTYLQTPVFLPPLDEQRRIAEVLLSVDRAIAAQSEVCDQTEITFNSLANASFAAGNEASSNVWPISPLGDLCESIQVGIVVRPASYYVEIGGIPTLRSLNVGENRLDLDDLVYISTDGHRLNSKSSLRPGDVVTRRTGEPGKTAVIPPLFPNGLNCIDIIFSRPTDKLRAAFLSFFMNSDAAKRQVTGLQGGLAQQHLNVGEMRKLKVPQPAVHVQDEVVETLKSASDRVEGEKALLDRLLSLRSAIGVDLLSGRVRVPT
jgi:type I restriction enzyme S subunit